MTGYNSQTVRRNTTLTTKQVRLLNMIAQVNARGGGLRLQAESRDVYAQALSDLQARELVTWAVGGAWERAGYVLTDAGQRALEAAS